MGRQAWSFNSPNARRQGTERESLLACSVGALPGEYAITFHTARYDRAARDKAQVLAQKHMPVRRPHEFTLQNTGAGCEAAAACDCSSFAPCPGEGEGRSSIAGEAATGTGRAGSSSGCEAAAACDCASCASCAGGGGDRNSITGEAATGNPSASGATLLCKQPIAG